MVLGKQKGFWKGLTKEEAYVVWAALCAVVENIHAPLYNLTEEQTQLGENLAYEIPEENGATWRGFTPEETEVISWVLSVKYCDVDGPWFTPGQEKLAEKLYKELDQLL